MVVVLAPIVLSNGGWNPRGSPLKNRPKENLIKPNHWFSGANLLLVSGRVSSPSINVTELRCEHYNFTLERRGPVFDDTVSIYRNTSLESSHTKPAMGEKQHLPDQMPCIFSRSSFQKNRCALASDVVGWWKLNCHFAAWRSVCRCISNPSRKKKRSGVNGTSRKQRGKRNWRWTVAV